jgi:hypothetical protein
MRFFLLLSFNFICSYVHGFWGVHIMILMITSAHFQTLYKDVLSGGWHIGFTVFID